MLSTRCTQPAGWQWYPAGYSRVTVHLLHSARWLAVVPRWVLSSNSPLAALSPLAGSGTPLGTLKCSRPVTDLRFSWWSQYFIHFRVASDQVGLRVHWSRALAKFFTPPYSIQHLQTLPTIHARRRSRLLVTAPPITCNRSPTRPHRTASSSLPASLRPAAPPACRPTCPGRLAWTRPLLCRAAQRLHAGKPCHAGSHGTRQKYHLEENTNKKSPILRCNNAFEEPDGYACASASCMAPALLRSFGTSSGPSPRASSRTPPGASFVQQQIAPVTARAGLKTAIRHIHA